MDKENRLGMRLMRFANEFHRKIDRMASHTMDAKITGPQGVILVFIERSEWQGTMVCQRDVEQELNLGKSTVSGLLKTLERDGLIQRESVPGDARLKRLSLTEKSRSSLREVRQQLDGLEQKLRDALTEEERAALFRILDKLQPVIEQ